MRQNNGARIILIRGLLLVILSLYFMVVFGQSPDLVSFNASKKEENIALQWMLAPSNKLSTIIIERKTTDSSFRSIAEFWVNFDGNTERNFKYTDKKVKSKTAQYRLKCIAADGKVQYSDIVLPGDVSVQKNSTKPSATKNKKPAADTALSGKDADHLKGLLLVQLIEREKNLL
ncbi:MAG: hypothetical protein ABUT20_35240 [Bacteroidota bacterium]